MHFTSSQLLAFIGLAVYAVAPVAGQYYDEDESVLSIREALAEYDLDLDDIAYLVARGKNEGDGPRLFKPQVKQMNARLTHTMGSAVDSYKANFAANKHIAPSTDPTLHDMAGAPDPTAAMRSQAGQMHKQAFINNAGPINDAAQTVGTAAALAGLIPQVRAPAAVIGAGATAVGHLAGNIVKQQKSVASQQKSAANAARFQGLQDQINQLSQGSKPKRRSIGVLEEEEAMLAIRDAWMEYDGELARRGIDAYGEEDYFWIY